MNDRPIRKPRTGANNPNWRGGPEAQAARKRASKAAYRARNRERILAERRARYAASPEPHRTKLKEYRSANREAVIAYNRTWSVGYRARLRSEMIAAYGGKCSCCGESEPRFMQLDHTHNDGHIDRKINKTSAKLWAGLKKLGWPKDRHQLLCANCNFGRLMNGGVCPHVR